MPRQRSLSLDDIEPLLHLQLSVQQVAALESTTPRSVQNWIQAGKFPEYSCHPNGGPYRVPAWSYLEFRKAQRVLVGEGVSE